MLQDEEFEAMVRTPERIAALGFKPQGEVLMNHLLPYAAELDEESNRLLEEIKTNLAKAVMLREMKPACCVWSSRLMKYIRLYGLKFSKEDHIAFIKLMYELVMIPDLEPSKVHKFATVFLMLTKKRQLISPKELTLPWRPLYEVGKKIFNKNGTSIGMYHYLTPKRRDKQDGDLLQMIRKFLSGTGLDDALNMFGFAVPDENELPTSLECSYLSMVKYARPYFDLSATKEIIDELFPQIYPWSSDGIPIETLSVFLPVALPPEHAAIGHELWFDKLMTFWDTCYNQVGITDLLVLFAGLAKRNPGTVNWSPYVPKMFAKFMHALNLPVCYKDLQISKVHNLDAKNMATWIVWSICNDGVVLKHLRSFLAGFESYLHSANAGRWTFKLRDLLRKLAKEFHNRVRRERSKKFFDSWENKTPESYKLTEEDITEFINIILGPTLEAVYSKSGLDISIALQNMSTLRPAIVVPPLLDRLRNGLTSLTEPHKVTAGMAAVASVARALLRGADAGFPEGPTHVVPFLMALLPALDPNDIKKTLVSLHFILIFSWMVPLIDCSSAHEYWDDLTEEELLTCESTAQIEDFVLLFLDRLFVIIESSVLENVRLDTKDGDVLKSKTDAVTEAGISSAAVAVLMQCSPKIFKEALRKFKAFATESTFETNVSGSMVGVLLRVFSRVDGESTLAAFVPKLTEELVELLSDEALLDENPSRDILYRLLLLKYVCECDGTVLLKYVPNIIPVLDRALRLREKTAQGKACEVLGTILQYFSFIEVKEWRSSTKDYGTAPKDWLPIREWGHGCPFKDAKLKWHVPSKEEADCVQMLIDRYLKPEIEKLRKWVNGEMYLNHEVMLRTLNIVNASLSCGSFFPLPNEEPVNVVESQVPATSLPIFTGVKYTVTLDGENVRVALIRLLVKVQAKMLADKSDDTKCFETLIHIWEHLLIVKFGRSTASLETRLRSFNSLERTMDGRGSPAKTGRGIIRMLVAEAARLHDDSRADLCESGITPSMLLALDSIFELSTNTYTTVRIHAQAKLYWMLSHYPYSYRVLVPKLSKLFLTLGEGEEGHEKHKGALCILLGPRCGPLIAKQDWETVRRLWPSVMKAPLSEKPSIHRLELALGDLLHRSFPTVNTRLVISDSAVEAAKYFISDADMNDKTFVSLLNNAVEKEKENSDKVEATYRALCEELVQIAETPNIKWSRLELVLLMLTFCPSYQTQFPVGVVKVGIKSLLHDDIAVRRIALRLTHYILRLTKRKLKKIYVDPYEMAGVQRPESHVPGYRKDLEWAVWSEEKVPLSDEDWEKPILRNPTYGFYAWPDKLKMAAPPSEQVFTFTLDAEQKTEAERFIEEFFSDDANIEKLVKFLAVEEKKGKDKFNALKFTVFRILFSGFGDIVYNKLLKAALDCASSTTESQQRFAAEIAAAAIRAPKYWPKKKALELHEKAFEILSTGLSTVTPETLEDWGMCLATGLEKMDPLRCSRLLDDVISLCVPPPRKRSADLDQNTFLVCARLYALQGALGAYKWRTAKLARQILEKLEAAKFTQHPYQGVRESVGSLLMTIFDTELVFPGGALEGAPCLAEFIESVQPRLAALFDKNGDLVVKPITSMALEGSSREDQSSCCEESVSPLVGQVAIAPAVHVARLSPDPPVAEDAEQVNEGESASDTESMALCPTGVKQRLSSALDVSLSVEGEATAPAAKDHVRASNLLTTVMRACMGVTVRSVRGDVSAQYAVASIAYSAAARGMVADEMPRSSTALLSALASAHHTPTAFHIALHTLLDRINDRSWWARLACLEFAQPLLYYGLPYLCAEPELAMQAETVTLKLMKDPRLEVRLSASKLLTGLMHCRALIDEDKTLKQLKRSCHSKDLVERHHGVLGLCSYLASRPYSLGPRIGDVLTELSRHTNAPDPIPATITNFLAEFRRTHQDDWAKHRDQLTEEELDLIADLTSPPSYCA